MGLSSSKREDTVTPEKQTNEDEYFVALPTSDRRECRHVEELRKEYQKTPDLFVLNQVLFSVMFFHNYNQELLDSNPTETTISVKELSLTDDLFLTYIKPDDALSLVNKHVQFCATHGPAKDKLSPLISNRIFVIHENIQVVADADNHYANIDRPSLTAQVVEEKRKGYVRLKYIEDLKFKNSVSSNSSSLTNSDSSSAGYGSITYSRITEARTIKPMPKFLPGQKSLYPITEVKRKNENADGDLNISDYFVNSKSMREQFQQNWPQIAPLLEMDDDEMTTGFNYDSVYCTSSAKDNRWEIIPAVQLPKGAYQEFHDTKLNNVEKQTRYNRNKKIFPTRAMLKKIVHLDRLAIPRGFISKYRDEVNKNCHLEWELAHPKVEKFLQQQLSHTHYRTLLSLILLFKTFIEPKTTTQGVTIRHLVIHFFWELEKKVVIRETHMGTRLIQIIDSFCTCLGKGELKDYFVPERNHFKNIPSEHTHHALLEMSQTRERPLQNFMAAIRNLRYRHDDFPELNIMELYKILTKPLVPIPRILRPEEKRVTTTTWEERKRAKIMKEKAQKTEENLKPKRKASVDSIVESTLKCKPEEGLEQERSCNLLTFFLKHYIAMAVSLNNLGNVQQARSYLRQGNRLTYLFHKSCETDASQFQSDILRLQKAFDQQEQTKSVTVPTLPDRSSSVNIPKKRLINQNSMDPGKIHQQYQNTDTRQRLARRRQTSDQSHNADSDSDSVEHVYNQRHQRKRNESEKSESDKNSNVPKRTKSVMFSSQVILPKDPSEAAPIKRDTQLQFVTMNLNSKESVDQTDQIQYSDYKSESSEASFDQDSDHLKVESSEEEDLDGLDEIISDDEDARGTVVQAFHPFDFQNKKINLGYNAEETYL